MTITTLITNHVPRHLEGSPEAASAALRRLEPLQPLRDGLTALGLAHLVSLRRTEVPAATATEAVSFGLAWPLADGSSSRVAWTLSVAPAGDGDSLLSASIRAGTDSAAGQQLLTAWALLGRIVESHTTRLLNTVTWPTNSPRTASSWRPPHSSRRPNPYAGAPLQSPALPRKLRFSRRPRPA